MRRIVVISLMSAFIGAFVGFAAIQAAAGAPQQDLAKARRLELQGRRELEKLNRVTEAVEQDLRTHVERLQSLRETHGDKYPAELDLWLIRVEVLREVWRELLEKSLRARLELDVL